MGAVTPLVARGGAGVAKDVACDSSEDRAPVVGAVVMDAWFGIINGHGSYLLLCVA